MLRVHHLLPRTCANGPGWRSALWLQGCALACPGCFNPETHAPTGADVLTPDEVFARLVQPDLEGITISGGEPLQQVDGLTVLLRRIRQETGLSVLLFSGHPWPVVQRHEALLACVDVVLAGPYVAEQRVARNLLGSANKSIHFLTDRYGPADLQQVPEAEIIITESGDVVMTGINPMEAPR